MIRGLLCIALFLAVVASLTVGCGEEEVSLTPSPQPQDGQAAPANGLPMDFETIDMGQYSGIAGQRPEAFKIETQVQWEELWARHQAIVMPAPAPPPVDFSRQMVIAAVDGQEPSGGYRLEITGIEEVAGRLEVRVSKEIPGPDCLVTAALTQPFHIVRTARSDLEPRLVTSEETYSCG